MCRATISESFRNNRWVHSVWSCEAVLEYWWRQKNRNWRTGEEGQIKTNKQRNANAKKL